MDKLRTPDERFASLPGYPFEPHYVEVDDQDGGTLRVHYVDEGAGRPVLMLHGEPSWSFLYRKMVPVLVEGGFRAIAPDLPGFGRSDKPAKRSDYTYARHVAWMAAFLESLDLQDAVLVGQDWGGLIGLRLVAEHPDRFGAVVAANTFLPRGEPAGEAFLRWQKFSQSVEEFPTSFIIQGATTTELPPDVLAAYDAPFPDESYKEGARQFPVLVPTGPDDPAIPDNLKAWDELQKWEKPFLTAFSDGDPITRGGDRALQTAIPGAQGQPHTTIEGGGHFLQEDKGPELAAVIVSWLKGL